MCVILTSERISVRALPSSAKLAALLPDLSSIPSIPQKPAPTNPAGSAASDVI